MGYLADRFDGYILIFISSFLSNVVVLCIWGFGKTFTAPPFLFSVLLMVFVGGYRVLYCRFATALTNDDGTQAWLYSIFEIQRGVVTILGGFISGPLVSGATGIRGYGFGSYERLILVVGMSMLISSFGGIGWVFRGKVLKYNQLFRSRQSLALWRETLGKS